MVKRKTRQALEGKLNELKMNLENNYKDLARTALKEYQELVEQYRSYGELKEKDSAITVNSTGAGIIGSQCQ